MFVWTGAKASNDWTDPSNWLDGRVPDATTDVFVAAATGGQSPELFYPILSATQETRALVTDTASHIDLNRQELYVRGDSLAADGVIFGGVLALGTVETQVRGIVSALLVKIALQPTKVCLERRGSPSGGRNAVA